MPDAATDLVWDTLDRFEERIRHDGRTDLADYLPPADHPDHLELLTELTRLDMEFAWTRGAPRSPEYYFDRFPALRADEDATGAVAFEDFRQRERNGRPADPFDYRQKYGISTADWPGQATAADESERPSAPPADELDVLPPTEMTAAKIPPVPFGPVAAPAPPRPADKSSDWPKLGTTFLGFELTDELGRGMFGRVYLAGQAGLANRSVALKVGRGLFHESQTLAQLQHTNVVPIYSYHQSGDVQAVCMPFFGRATLAHLVRAISTAGAVPETAANLSVTVRTGGSVARPQPAQPEIPDDPTVLPLVTPATDPGGLWEKFRTEKYVDAVVWIGSQLAAGLAHAHQQGILHRDLKPANVLLTDGGVPMLLDFNRASDLRPTHATPAVMGGTLPYMSPEQLRAFAGGTDTLNERTDTYALGIVLFEALTGRRPFPDRTGGTGAVVRGMLDDRSKRLPSLRESNPHVPFAIEAVVHKLLAFDPADRYQSAAGVADDLSRHLAYQPLRHAPEPSARERARKWAKRHPRLTSSASVAGVAAALLAGAIFAGFAARERAYRSEARVAFADHTDSMLAIQALIDDRHTSRDGLDDGLRRSEASLARYGIPADATALPAGWDDHPRVRYLPDADRAALRDSFGEVLFLMARAGSLKAKMADTHGERVTDAKLAEAWNRAADGFAGDRLPRAVRQQRADLAALAGRDADAKRLAAEADATGPASARDKYLLGYWYQQSGKPRQAIPHLTAATMDDPKNFSAWFVRGATHFALEQPDLAAVSFSAAVALRPEFPPVWVNRGLAFARMRLFELAVADYDAAIRLDANKAEPHFLRAGALAEIRKPAEALAGYADALACADCPTRVYFYRANVRERLTDEAGAAADRAEGMRLIPQDEISWVARAEVVVEKDPDTALRDVERALAVNPLSADGLQMKSMILADKLGRPADAEKALNKLLDVYPEHVPARAGRAVLRARAGDRAGAHGDAETALARDSRAPNLYQVGCVYALTAAQVPADRFKAIEYISAATQAGFGKNYLKTDKDLNPIRASDEFQRLLKTAGD